MTTRSRLVAFGSAGLLVLVGVVVAVAVSSGPGQIVGLVLISLGAVLATSLVFFEVGLSEDRERGREAAGRKTIRVRRPRSRLRRRRGEQRRLK